MDQWAADHASQAQRDRVATALVRLAVREFFEMGLVQTDPNFGNYLFDARTGKVALLDFGTAEKVVPTRARQLTELSRAMRDGDAARISTAATRAGFICRPCKFHPATVCGDHPSPSAVQRLELPRTLGAVGRTSIAYSVTSAYAPTADKAQKSPLRPRRTIARSSQRML